MTWHFFLWVSVLLFLRISESEIWKTPQLTSILIQLYLYVSKIRTKQTSEKRQTTIRQKKTNADLPAIDRYIWPKYKKWNDQGKLINGGGGGRLACQRYRLVLVKNGPTGTKSQQLSENSRRPPHPQLTRSSQIWSSDPELNTRPAHSSPLTHTHTPRAVCVCVCALCPLHVTHLWAS